MDESKKFKWGLKNKESYQKKNGPSWNFPKMAKKSEKEELKEQYDKYIAEYRDIFGHEPITLFKHIKIRESLNDQLDFRHTFSPGDVLQIDTNFQAVSEKIIEFTTILSFLHSDILRNDAIYNLLFVFFFQISENSEIVKLREGMIKEIKNLFEQIVQARVAFVEMVIQILPLKLLLSEFLHNINPNISNMKLLHHLRSYYQRYILSIIDVSAVRSTLNQQLILPEWFQSQKKNRQVSQYLNILSKSPYMFITMALHYEKIGLNLYFTHIHFTNASNTAKIIKKYFLPVSFFTLFTISQNRFFTFYATIPGLGLINLERYLHKLKGAGHIHEYKITQAISSDYTIQLNKKYSGNILLSQMKLFNSKKYSHSSINAKKNSHFQENLILYQDSVNYLDEYPSSDFKINSLFLFLFFKSREFFLNFENFQSIYSFLRHIQQDISRSPFSRIARKYPTINFFEKHFNNDQDQFLNPSYKKKKNLVPNRNYHKYNDLLKELGHKNKKAIYSSTFDKIIRSPWSDFAQNFSKKSHYSREILQNHISTLLHKGFIQESNIMSVASILQIEKSTLPFFVFSKDFIKWIQKIALYHTKNDFHETTLKSNKLIRQIFFISVSSYFLLLKWLLLEDLQAINIISEQYYKRIDLKILNLFDFTGKNQWNPHLFKLDHLLDRMNKTSNKSIQKSFHLQRNIGKEKFQFKAFYHDLKLIGELNEINKLLENKEQQFLIKIRDLYHSKPLDISYLKEKLSLTKDQEIHFEEAFCSDIIINPVLSSQKRIILIFNQPNSDLSPLLFLKDSLLRGFFHISLVNAWMFGGRYDAIMILEYKKDISSLENENSVWNHFLRKVKETYPNLEIDMYEISREERFFNKKAFFPVDWRESEYLNFSPSRMISEVDGNLEKISYTFETIAVSDNHNKILSKYLSNQDLTEIETNLLLESQILYPSTFYSFKYWQITGYTFAFVLLIENPGKRKKKLLNLIHQLPIGKILHLINMADKTSKLCIHIQLRDRVTNLWGKLVLSLEAMKIKYIISPTLPLEVYHSTIFPALFKISKKNLRFKYLKGKPIELPIFPLRMRREAFTPEVQINLFKALMEKYPTGETNLTHSRWIKIQQELRELRCKSLISYESVLKILE